MVERRRILIDGFNLGLEKGTGIATYARNLSFCTRDLGYETNILYGLPPAPGAHALLHEIAFFDSNAGQPPQWLTAARLIRDRLAAPLGGVTPQRVPITGDVVATHYRSRMPYFDAIWNSPNLFGRAEKQVMLTDNLFARQWRLRVHFKQQPHIAHWTYPLPMYVPGAKNIYTLHDLVPLRLPFTTLDNKRHYLRLMRSLARTADHIVTVSETSRKDIMDLLGIPESKVTNTYQSVEIPAKYADKTEDVVKREVEGSFDVKYKKYFLFYGAVEPKKNVGRLIEAFLGANVETPLLIVGKLAWKSEQELRMLSKDNNACFEMVDTLIRRKQRIFQIDYASFPLLVSLIKAAKGVLFPSLYEGFGLPILEAMKLGTPVLTSTEGSTLEVAGDGALLVDPYDTQAIAKGIIALDGDAELRASLSEKGRRRAGSFSPEAHSRRLSAVYDSVLSAERPRRAVPVKDLVYKT